MVLMINNQRPEPARHSNGDEIDVHSMFYTLQGEGPFTGYPSIFLRLAGCNLQCPGCDTEYTLNRRVWQRRDLVNALHDMFALSAAKLLVITGGEPLRQNIVPFIIEFWNVANFPVQIETNGVICPDGIVQLIKDGILNVVISPKTSRIHPELALHARAYKYVLECNAVEPDGLPRSALHHPAKPYVARPPEGWTGPIYLNPMDEKNEEKNRRNVKAVIDSCMEFGYIAGSQCHKQWELP